MKINRKYERIFKNAPFFMQRPIICIVSCICIPNGKWYNKKYTLIQCKVSNSNVSIQVLSEAENEERPGAWGDADSEKKDL